MAISKKERKPVSAGESEVRVKDEGTRTRRAGKMHEEGTLRGPEPEQEQQLLQDAEEDGDLDAEGEEEEEMVGEEEGGSAVKRRRLDSTGRKRDSARGSSQNPSADPDLDAEGEEEEEEVPTTRVNVKTQPRDTDGYIPGSIVRIQLKNFVTYDYVQFHCGPYLNMILGPNGTGKSSIACAIALGLNFPPSILGRASDLNSFVKLGTDKGYIEIELKGPKHKGNYTIRRHLSSTSRASTFTLNGQSVPAREVSAKMVELNVQVGNLCSFLPQDRVSEFAAMSPQQLLRETQRAAGDERLTQWHDTLISAGRELRVVQEAMKEEQETLTQLRDRNAAIERDVQRFRERKRIEREIQLLEVLIPVEEYRVSRKKFIEQKGLQRVWHDKVRRLKEKNAPVHQLLESLEKQVKSQDKRREDLKKSTLDKFKQMVKQWEKNEKLDNESEDISAALDGLKREEKDRQRRIKVLESEVTQTKEELGKPLEVESVDDLNEEQKKMNQDKAAVMSRKGNIEADLKRNVDLKSAKQVEVEGAQAELKKLDDILERKMQNMAQVDRDTHDVILWLRKNQHRFKKEVIEPAAIVLNVPDQRFVHAVEACCSVAQLRTFVAQSQEDLDLFNSLVNDGNELGRRVRVTTWFRAQREEVLPPEPMSRDQMRGLGFDGYALDYVDCPQGLHWFLKRELNLHRTAIALNPNIDVARAMELVGAGGGGNFLNGQTMNNISRSQYGKRAVTNMTKEIKPARTLHATMIDPEVKQKHDLTIMNARQEISLLEEERRRLDADMAAIREEERHYDRKATEIRRRREAITRAQARRINMEAKLGRDEKELDKLLNAPPVDEKRKDLKRRLLKLSTKRLVIMKEYRDLARAVMDEQRECCKAGIEGLQISANRAALKAECERKDEKYQLALIEFEKVNKAYKRIKQESKDKLEHSRQVIAGVTGDLKEEYETNMTVRIEYDRAVDAAEAAAKEGRHMTPPSAEGVDVRSLEELQEEMENQKAKLELNLNTNPGIVEQYERRKAEIEALEGNFEEKQRKAERYERSIKSSRDNWQPALEKLVASIGEKFSAAFDRIGCAGEIRISPHEDYDKWAIDILVKFRDSERLQLLTAHRQSGGERSLSTILYLMSLTEEARAPFSLVDEINQGMDKRAERMVHNSLVEVTCKPDSAQHFLITPKLLPDLEYHERMKILCVNNGEWLPEERNLGNMMRMVEGFVVLQQRKGKGGGSGVGAM
ncbi:hypothetical protein AMATHDRAFT_61100 [Amanita thiersii Skay4041]|uniref:Structural maintenance of chromosomes protein 5 n=1 Tax=Amanita thiersii Skay4041 TaxID=703135 RepID=A0A2A9NRS0_9AGAR|nr:hypothetical protein AMATHDRAFT_61100 [Amanita thiersii Skay4041]